MTKTQYRRLLIVITVPLLIAGAIFTRAVIRPDNFATILCDNSTIFGENCRITDGLGEKWDLRLRSEQPAWFDIQTRPYEKNSFPTAIVSGSQRLVSGIRIVSVTPYSFTDDSPGSPIDELRALTGREIAIVFGNREDDPNLLNPLGCNELIFDGSNNIYTAGLCGVPNGVAQVKFTASGEASKQLEKLKEEIEKEIASEKRNIIVEYALGTPLFIILFLLGSSVVWSVRKAVSYVRAG